MELKESFDTIFNENKFEDALVCIRNNSQEATIMLIEKLQQEISELDNEQTKARTSSLNKTLELLAMLGATDAFPLFLKLLESRVQMIHYNNFGTWLYKIIPDEASIPLLMNYATNQAICEAARLAACNAVNIFYRQEMKLNDLENFFKNVIFSFDKRQFNQGKNLSLLFGIIQSSIDLGFIGLSEELKGLLIQLIIKSEKGRNSGWFEKYFEYLYKLDPLIAAKIHEIKAYIRTLDRCIDKELFQYDDFVSIGKYLFSKTLESFKDANPEMIKMAIKSLRQYPFNKRIQPTNNEEYYKEICFYLGMKKIPKEIYSNAQQLYQDVFGVIYPELKGKIEILVNKTKTEHEKLLKESESSIAEFNKNISVLKDVVGYKSKLVRNYLRRKELNALYKEDSQGNESGLLPYYLKESECFFNRFCDNTNAPELVDEKLRELSIQCVFSDNLDIEDYFSHYSKIVRQLDLLLDENPFLAIYNIFYNIKFMPFYENIMEKYRKNSMMGNAEERNYHIKEINIELENHPLFPRTLIECAGRGAEEYCSVLEKFSHEVVLSIRNALSNSTCLKKRKPLIEHCLHLVEDKENELSINLLPVQIEGLFADLLEYTTIFDYISNIKLYQTILNLELAEKIDFGISKDINISFNAVAYFKYYFSSIVRNTVAHGNYTLLVEGKTINNGNCYRKEDDDIIKRILTLELLLDLNYLIHTIYDINEIDTAIRYIDYSAKNYMSLEETEEDRAILYECLFDDLNGTRNRFNISGYKSGIFVTYNPIQILHWIFNPYYEKYMDADSLKLIRDSVCSLRFWKYVENKLETSWIPKSGMKLFQKVVKKMIGIAKSYKQTDEETMNLLKNINKKLNDIPS
ncbi:hypothetical protein [Clostridium butyricum]|uniref:hypothetical protein n=1 Tax=Clostridium butyricum TaxID=1492 RepID=UPI00374FC82A